MAKAHFSPPDALHGLLSDADWTRVAKSLAPEVRESVLDLVAALERPRQTAFFRNLLAADVAPCLAAAVAVAQTADEAGKAAFRRICGDEP